MGSSQKLLQSLISIVTFAVLLFPARSPIKQAPNSIYFNDSGPNILVGNDYLELTLSKSNGGILSIQDKATGQNISDGNLNTCLWVIVFDYDISDYIESCSYSPSGSKRFSYAWSPSTAQLSLSYQPDPGLTKSVTATVTLKMSSNNWFDLQMTMINNWGYAPDDVKFPNIFVFSKNDIQEALLPALPGVILKSSFFSRGLPYEGNYPGGFFADFMAIKSTRGRLAIYSISPGDKIVPLYLGFYFNHCENTSNVCYTHNYDSGVKNGQSWISPTVRMRVAEDYLASIQAYRIDNGIHLYPTSQTKLGGLYEPLRRLPLYKADFGNKPFNQYADYLADIQYPGILHMVAYWEGGFDEHYPDFQIPNPTLGTKSEMIAMMEGVKSLGYLVMPYTNPTWWDDESPTLSNLPAPLTINDLAVLDSNGNPKTENYGSHFGYVMSPYPDFVQDRLATLMQQMTQEYPSDLIHEDQVGGRSSIPDYNPSSPTIAAFAQGWLEHTQLFKDKPLTCEHGSDRLAATETGFHGSVLLAVAEGKTSSWWGDGNWFYYPFAPALFRDKVLLYHNTEGRSSTTSKAVLSMNLAFGYMLSYDLGYLGKTNPWLNVVGAYQKNVLSRFAGEKLVNYQSLSTNITRSDFENYSVETNWSQSAAYASGEYTIAINGSLVTANDGKLIAGIFSDQYNGHPLTSGDHFIIEDRQADRVIIYQSMGADTFLTIDFLPGWNSSTPLGAWIYNNTGKAIGFTPVGSSIDGATFEYKSAIGGSLASYYVITEKNNAYLPIIKR